MNEIQQYGLAGVAVFGLLFLAVVIVSFVGGIVWWTRIISTRIKQRRARARFTREARELAVKRSLARQRRLVGPEPEPLPEDARFAQDVERWLKQRSSSGER